MTTNKQANRGRPNSKVKERVQKTNTQLDREPIFTEANVLGTAFLAEFEGRRLMAWLDSNCTKAASSSSSSWMMPKTAQAAADYVTFKRTRAKDMLRLCMLHTQNIFWFPHIRPSAHRQRPCAPSSLSSSDRDIPSVACFKFASFRRRLRRGNLASSWTMILRCS